MENIEEIYKTSLLLDTLQAQTYSLVDYYDIFTFLLGDKSNDCKFSEFQKWYKKANEDVGRAITMFLGIGHDSSVQKAVADAKILLKSSIALQKSEKTFTKTQFLGGNHQIYDQFVKYINYGLVKSLESPGKTSKNAFFLAGESNYLFVKPVKKKESVENEVKAYNLAVEMGLDSYLLPVCSVELNKSEYAIITPLLSFDSMSLDKFEKMREGAGDGLVKNLIDSGDAHKLALFDYLIQNSDRHRNNIFVENGKIKLIDQGEAFKKKENSFIPGYLRLKEFKVTKQLPLCKNYVELRNYVNNLPVSDDKLRIIISNINKSLERVDVQVNELWAPFIED